MQSIRQLIPKQFSLRAAFIFLSLACLVLGWTKLERDRIARLRQLAADIRESGGQILERHTARSLGFDFPCEDPKKPNWIQRILAGETVQDRPQWVILSGSSIADDDLDRLSELRTLRHLSLYDTRATDAGVALLKNALPSCQVHRH